MSAKKLTTPRKMTKRNAQRRLKPAAELLVAVMRFRMIVTRGPTTNASSFSGGKLLPQQVFHISELVAKQVQFARQSLDFDFRAAVDLKVQLAAQAVLLVLAVLAHHDDRRLDCGQHGEKKVQENKRIRVPGPAAQ